MRSTAKSSNMLRKSNDFGKLSYPLKNGLRKTEGLVEKLRYEAKMQHTKFVTNEQDINAAMFRMHELEKRLTLLNDENGALTQKV